jgi:poly(A) polymerase
MLTVADKISPPDWMTSEEVVKLYHILNDDEQAALFVGGCVRNLLLGAPVKDVDLACIYTPDEVIKKLEENAIKAIPTGLDHGTITAVINDKAFEITTLRKDIKTDGRRAVVGFTKDWVEDAKRRDFTMNTLLCDLKGNIYDPLETGIKDLKNREVIFVGDASKRIAEDVLRILRYFRFYAYYGGNEADKSALKACSELAHLIKDLSKERVSDEFFKIIMAENAKEILSLMFSNNVLTDLPAASYNKELLINEHLLETRLLIISGLNEGAVEHLSKFFILSKKQKKRIDNILKAYLSLDDLMEGSVKKLFYYYGKEDGMQALYLYSSLKKEGLNIALSIFKDWEIPVFPVSGEDLLKKGFKQDKGLGEILKKLELWWVDNEFSANKEALLEKLNHLT